MDYVPKYGAVTSTILVINEKEMITDISKTTIHEAFEKAKNSMETINV